MSSTPRAPTGDVERWLITEKESGAVYGVVWDVYWFSARARGAAFYFWQTEGSIGRLEVTWCPPSPEEKASGAYRSGRQIADDYGRKLGSLKDVQQSPPTAPKRRVQCPEIYTFKNGVSSSFCTKEKGHDGKHKGWRKEWE
jgi:hypothetical protein